MCAQLRTDFSIQLIYWWIFRVIVETNLTHFSMVYTLTCYLLSIFAVPHGTKAFTALFYFFRSAWIFLSYKRNPSFCSSFSTVRLHIVLGLDHFFFFIIPLLPSLSWCYSHYCDLASEWVIFRLLYFTSSLSGFILAPCNSSLVLSSSCRFIWTIFRRYLFFKQPRSIIARVHYRIAVPTSQVSYIATALFPWNAM